MASEGDVAVEEKGAEAEAGEEKEEAGARPAATEKPKELEEDAPAGVKGARLEAGAVGFLVEDTTLNVMPSANGGLLMALSDGGFQYLLAGARANVGVKAGRYMFEVMIAEARNPAEPPNARAQGPKPRHLVRVGFATAESPLLLPEGLENVCFDSEGMFLCGEERQRVSQKFSWGQTVGVLLNLDPASPNANTISLFRNGVRVSEPQKLPEALKGKALYPAVTYRNATVQVNFGPSPLRPLPFKCLTLQEAAVADCTVRAASTPPSGDGRCEVVFPVGLADQGPFDWLDGFLEKHRNYVELSDRAILAWAEKSGVTRQGGYAKRQSNDKPEPNFGLPHMDDASVNHLISSIAPSLRRNYVVMEVKGNLTAADRKATMSHFDRKDFRVVAKVVIGEPPADFKEAQQAALLDVKRARAEAEAKRKGADAARKRADEFRKKKAAEEQKKRAEAAKKAREAKLGTADSVEEGGDKQDTAEEEEPPAKDEEAAAAEEEPVEEVRVELTDAEKQIWFRKKDTPDLTAKELSASYAGFTIPAKDEGFDEVEFLWHKEGDCQAHLRQWIAERKLTQRVEDLQPSEWFKDKWSEWAKLLNAWKKRQQDFKDPAKKRAAALAKKEGDGSADAKMDINADDLDVFAVDDVMDIGNGEPLFANFAYEDWCLLSVRFELHLLVHAFRHDLNDPERQSFHETHLSFYYQKYFKKNFTVKHYNVGTARDLVELVKDSVEISAKGSSLESQLSDDTPMDNFVKLTEEHRRDRERRIDAGDETATLKFSPPAQAPPRQGPQAQQPRGGGNPPRGPPGRGGPHGGQAFPHGQKRPQVPGPSNLPPAKQQRSAYGGPGFLHRE